MVNCGMFARGLIKLFKTFSSKSIMSRVHVCARLETALSHAGIRIEDLPSEMGGTSDFDMGASITTLCDADPRELPVNGHQVRDDFAHFHRMRHKMQTEAVLAHLEGAAEGTGYHMKFRRTAGMFSSIQEYEYVLKGALFYTWPCGSSTVHKIMEPQEVAAVESNRPDQFPFAVRGHLGDGSFVTWTPIASSAHERDETMGRIRRSIASLRTAGAAAAMASAAPVVAEDVELASKEE